MFNAWPLAVDFGIASVLILLCKYIRINFSLLQKTFIPVSMMAGLLALVLGKNGFDILPLSDISSSYSSIMIAVIFGSIGLGASLPNWSILVQRTGKLFAYNQIITISQWFVAIAVTTYLFKLIWPDLPPAFGLILPSGFMGGHGTAAAVGESLSQMGWDEAMSLALTIATVGVFLAVLGGLIVINVIARLGHVTHLKKFEELEKHFLQGVVPESKRESIALETVSSSSVNVFTLHVCLVGLVILLAYGFANYVSSLNDMLYVPVFACAFLIGGILRMLLVASKLKTHFDDKLFSLTASSGTDFLVFFGIASIEIKTVLYYTGPFLLLLAAGVLLCSFLVFYIAPKVFGNTWVERGIFSWGWMTGTVAMGILLLRIVDPDSKSKVLDDYAIAYVPGAVVDILLVSLVPGLIILGHVNAVLTVLFIYLCVVSILCRHLIKK